MPPPPYIDDGSHDLLQEAITMEELEQKKSSHSPTKPPASKLNKPRKQVTLDEDGELLSLAIDIPTKHSESESLLDQRNGFLTTSLFLLHREKFLIRRSNIRGPKSSLNELLLRLSPLHHHLL